ncbi:MAG: hypothetical protein LBH06_04910 [Rikenellaceae bacterium]|jgi:hypothetical protein|nr:hypothetical protein [Rikenellaceae bacterium]
MAKLGMLANGITCHFYTGLEKPDIRTELEFDGANPKEVQIKELSIAMRKRLSTRLQI